MRRMLCALLAFGVLALVLVAGAEVIARRGDRGEAVAEIQRALIERGLLTGPTDGVFGQGTEEAVKRFQTLEGLQVDGIVGTRTRERLMEPTATATPSPAATSAPTPEPEKTYASARPDAQGAMTCSFGGIRAQSSRTPGGYLVVLQNEGEAMVDEVSFAMRWTDGYYEHTAELVPAGRELGYFVPVPAEATMQGMRLTTAENPRLAGEDRAEDLLFEVVRENGEAHVSLTNQGPYGIDRIRYTLVYLNRAGEVLGACEERGVFSLASGDTVELTHSGAPFFSRVALYINQAVILG